MTQKTISLPVDVYERLKQMKKDNESYGDTIARLMNQNENKKLDEPISTFAGAFNDEDSDDWGEIEKVLYQKRRFSPPRDTSLDPE